MSLTPVALVLPSVQRHHLEAHPDERALVRRWAAQVETARTAGQLVVLVQWDGEAGSNFEPFSRGWTLHPDFRAEAGDLMARVGLPERGFRPGLTELWDELHARAVRTMTVMALPDLPERTEFLEAAQAQGFQLTSG